MPSWSTRGLQGRCPDRLLRQSSSPSCRSSNISSGRRRRSRVAEETRAARDRPQRIVGRRTARPLAVRVAGGSARRRMPAGRPHKQLRPRPHRRPAPSGPPSGAASGRPIPARAQRAPSGRPRLRERHCPACRGDPRGRRGLRLRRRLLPERQVTLVAATPRATAVELRDQEHQQLCQGKPQTHRPAGVTRTSRRRSFQQSRHLRRRRGVGDEFLRRGSGRQVAASSSKAFVPLQTERYFDDLSSHIEGLSGGLALQEWGSVAMILLRALCRRVGPTRR
mmetsp:Transcript_47573/g.136813  ORF Transcript_47573/g.136813 Transcript_47573/m.136813 type:complete len:279 (+) Transcript_47573:1297-2133(+)